MDLSKYASVQLRVEIEERDAHEVGQLPADGRLADAAHTCDEDLHVRHSGASG